jgi:hypothetical protein
MPYTTVITFVAYDPLAAADLNSNFSNLDYLNNKVNAQFILLAGAMKPAAFSPAAPGEVEMTTNKNNLVLMDFPGADGSLAEVDIAFPMPSDYGGGTVTAKFYWTANSTSTNAVVWQIRARCVADDESLDGAYGTTQTVTDANKSSAYDLNISDATPALTIAGTPAAGELVQWNIYRYADAAADTLAVTARLIAVAITYTRA